MYRRAKSVVELMTHEMMLAYGKEKEKTGNVVCCYRVAKREGSK